MIKTFRNRLAPNKQDTIRLRTNNGLTGYRIVKFQIISAKPGLGTSTEFVVKIFTQPPASIDGEVNFSDPLLLGVAYETDSVGVDNPTSQTIIFDHVKFNQDIFVSAVDNSGGSNDVNYYLELEQVKLTVDEAAVATLKDMRGSE
tara:strand:+ start:265 stop:699 length:435 start_codon:yes stop_codon:yes gene_type:complete